MSFETIDTTRTQDGAESVRYREEEFPALRLTRTSRFVRRVGRVMLVALVLSLFAMLFVPWQQSIRGEGAVVAFDPFERPQTVEAPVTGRIAVRGEGVREGAYVKKGQLLFGIVNQDPDYLSRLQAQEAQARSLIEIAKTRLASTQELREKNASIVGFTDQELDNIHIARDELVKAYDRFVDQAQNKVLAEQNKLVAAEAKLYQAEADYKRKLALFEEGIESELKMQETEQKYRDSKAYVKVAEQELEVARNGLKGMKNQRESIRQEWEAKIKKLMQELEKAKAEVDKADIEIKKTTEDINQKEAKLIDQQSKVAAQSTQDVFAPRDGYIMDLAVIADSSFVDAKDSLCRIVPRTEKPAVQLWVTGNDAPLISEGRHVRLQFEGWPAVQFSGWPSVAVGTFGGVVALVDPTDDGLGRFRIVVVPDKTDAPWPKYPYLRQGVRANGWVLLDTVPLGYEIWRRMNGFPPALKDASEVNKSKPPTVKI